MIESLKFVFLYRASNWHVWIWVPQWSCLGSLEESEVSILFFTFVYVQICNPNSDDWPWSIELTQIQLKGMIYFWKWLCLAVSTKDSADLMDLLICPNHQWWVILAGTFEVGQHWSNWKLGLTGYPNYSIGKLEDHPHWHPKLEWNSLTR